MKLASIEVVKNIRKHPNADALDLCDVLGWQTVVKKDSYSEGQKVVFITIDSLVPRYPWVDFLGDKNDPKKPVRIKNIKLRGEYSSGLVVPLSEFPPNFQTFEVGENITELIGVQKYVKELPANLSGENEGDFPTHIISKTDEDNGLNDPDLVQEVITSSSELTVTQKIDGSSITLVVENGELKSVCSRNLAKKETENSTFWKAARKLNIPKGWTGTIQGELAGNGIQKNPLKLSDIRIFVFQIKVDHHYMSYEVMKNFCETELKCDVVPLILKLSVEESVKLWINPLQKLQELADKQKYNSGLHAEGIVVRPSHYPKSRASRRPLGFKLINRNYND